MIPLNFQSTQINNIVDMKSQKSMIITIDLIIVVMLNHENSVVYIESIMNNLSETAKDDIQILIERSRNNLDDLISSRHSEAGRSSIILGGKPGVDRIPEENEDQILKNSNEHDDMLMDLLEDDNKLGENVMGNNDDDLLGGNLFGGNDNDLDGFSDKGSL